MRKERVWSFLIFLLLAGFVQAQRRSIVDEAVHQAYALDIKHTKDTLYYDMVSTLLKHAPDGKLTGTDTYHLYLRIVPGAGLTDTYTCLKFTLQSDRQPELSIPSLTNWTYHYGSGSETDQKGNVFGIDHGPFEKLADNQGKEIPAVHGYHVYNAFIDFHALGFFAEKTSGDSGIQNLTRIGQRIVHASAFSQPPVNLGTQIAEGSYFKNGKITLEFKGIGNANGKPVAILGYDSGESRFHMIMKPMPNLDVVTEGKSHYWGDVYKDLSTGWIQKASLQEIVISETTISGQSNKIPSVVERNIQIGQVKRFDF